MGKIRDFSYLPVIAALFLAGCAGRATQSESAPPAEASSDQQLENLSAAVSRLQTRLEEIDAKVASLADKTEANRVTLDNLAGNKPLKTEVIGGNAGHAPDHSDDSLAPVPAIPAAIPAGRSRARGAHKAPAPEASVAHDEAVGAFSKAMHLFKTGKFSDSELAFNQFAESFPDHILAGSAQFYAGESYFMLGEYTLAVNEYGKVISSFASSPRVASAMVRMAQSYEAAGDKTNASRTLVTAKEMFPGNPSLEWPAPAAKGKDSEAAEKLEASPIEPETKHDL